MVSTRGKKRKDTAAQVMAEAVHEMPEELKQSNPVPQIPKENAAQISSIEPLNLFAIASCTNRIRSQLQDLKSNAEPHPFNAWRALLEPFPESLDLKAPQGQRSGIIPENEPQDSLSCSSSPCAENDQRDNKTSATLPRPSTSVAMTEIAQKCQASSEVDEEVDSAYDSTLVTFEGYRVKEEMAPLLSKIFAKHGDIAKNSVLCCLKYRSFLLQEVCSICQELERKNFVGITICEVNAMLGRIVDLENVKLNVEWLHEKLTKIKEAKELTAAYATFKGKMFVVETKEKELAKKTAELDQLQQEINLLNDELRAMKIDQEHYRQNMLEKKAIITDYYHKGLVDGLY